MPSLSSRLHGSTAAHAVPGPRDGGASRHGGGVSRSPWVGTAPDVDGDRGRQDVDVRPQTRRRSSTDTRGAHVRGSRALRAWSVLRTCRSFKRLHGCHAGVTTGADLYGCLYIVHPHGGPYWPCSAHVVGLTSRRSSAQRELTHRHRSAQRTGRTQSPRALRARGPAPIVRRATGRAPRRGGDAVGVRRPTGAEPPAARRPARGPRVRAPWRPLGHRSPKKAIAAAVERGDGRQGTGPRRWGRVHRRRAGRRAIRRTG